MGTSQPSNRRGYGLGRCCLCRRGGRGVSSSTGGVVPPLLRDCTEGGSVGRAPNGDLGTLVVAPSGRSVLSASRLDVNSSPRAVTFVSASCGCSALHPTLSSTCACWRGPNERSASGTNQNGELVRLPLDLLVRIYGHSRPIRPLAADCPSSVRQLRPVEINDRCLLTLEVESHLIPRLR